MKLPRILVAYASVGSGHASAARALAKALRAQRPDAAVELRDVLEGASPTFRRLYGSGYLGLAERAPHLVGYLYEKLDKPSHGGDALRRGVQRWAVPALARELSAGAWDVVVSTHFLPAELVAQARMAGRCSTPQAIVVTDFESHRIWAQRPCERFLVASAEAAQGLRHWGVPERSLSVTGIPIDPEFARAREPRAARAALGLDETRPVVLLLGGGEGMGGMEESARRLLELERPCQLVAVAGRNEALRARLARLEVPRRHSLLVLGYSDQVPSLMAASDLLVSKPGGLTTAEALAMTLPVVAVDPIPGQESRNAGFLVESGAGVLVSGPALLGLKVEALLASPERLDAMRRCALVAGRPHAAEEAAREVLALAQAAVLERSAAAPAERALRAASTAAVRSHQPMPSGQSSAVASADAAAPTK